MILGVQSSTCNTAIYAETGSYPIVIRQKIRLFRYWSRLNRLEDYKIVRQVYKHLRHLTDLGFNTWVSTIKVLLEEVDCSDLYNDDYVSSKMEESIVVSISDQLKYQFSTDCIKQLHSFPSLRTYVTFKQEFNLEQYLVEIKDYRIRNVITKLRLGKLPLHVEKGRHTKPKTPLEKRI